MSFTFNWPRFSDQFHHDAIQMLNTALNKGNKPPIIADKIEVVELEMGTQPPELEIRDIGDLTVDQFRGIFRLTYSGDAHLVLKTKVQANPLNHKQPDIHLMAGSCGMLAAQQPLVVPMLLRLSHFRLSSYVVLVVSKQKGITLVFKTDPLQNVDINSTFDSIAVIQKFIQREIEGQLRQMFREDLPGIIHRLSQQWVKAKVEAPYLDKRQPPTSSRPQPFETMSTPDLTGAGVGPHLHLARAHSLGTPSIKRSRSVAGDSVAGLSRRANAAKSAGASSAPPQTLSPDPASHGEYENFDPTYGLRPEGLPTKSGFRGFSSLFTPNKGLADLTEEPNSDEDDNYEDDGVSTSFDVVEWEDTVPDISPPPSVYTERGNTPEYETIPAVGGGTITRPRVLHSQSTIQPPPGIAPRLSHSSSRSQGSIRSGAITPSILTRHHSSGSSYLPDSYSIHNSPRTAPFYHTSRPRTPDSADSSTSGEHYSHPTLHHTRPPDLHSSSHPTHLHSNDLDSNNPIYIRRSRSERRSSVSSDASHLTATTTTSLLYPNTTTDPIATPSTSPNNNSTLSSSYPYPSEPNPKITLRPSLNNNSIHQLSSLSHSNHTLSPYTRSLSHFTVRSVPPRSWASSTTGVVGRGTASVGPGGERQPVKARRKRIFRLGGKKPTNPSPPTTSTTPTSTTLGPGPADFNTHFAFGPDGAERPRGTGVGAGSRAHQLRQYQFVPSEFDAEDMDRYFRSNEDLSIPAPASSVGTGTIPSSPPRLTTSQAVLQHLQQQKLYQQGQGQGSGAMGPGVPGLGNLGAPVAARRRQVSATPSRLR